MSIVIYARGHRAPDVHSRMYVPTFAEAHEARRWLDAFTRGKPVTREGNTLKLDDGITLRSDQLDQVLNAPVANEPLDPQVERWIARFKYGTWDEVHEQPEADDAPGDEQRPRRERQARADKPDGYVTITELCVAWNVLPRIARAALRASERVKPEYGWAFAPNEIDAIKKLVVDGQL